MLSSLTMGFCHASMAWLHSSLMLKRGAGNLPGVRAFGAEEMGVVAIPFAAAAELDNRQVPTEGHGNEALSHAEPA